MVMKAKSPDDYTALRKTVEHLQSLPPDQNPVTVALNKIATVHFARFAFLDHDQLAVITSYDGDFEVYINEFINEIGDVFDMLMEHVEDGPPLLCRLIARSSWTISVPTTFAVWGGSTARIPSDSARHTQRGQRIPLML